MKKVKAAIIGADSNIFNIMSICVQALRRAKYTKEALELVKRVTSGAKSYEDALQVCMEYVEAVKVTSCKKKSKCA